MVGLGHGAKWGIQIFLLLQRLNRLIEQSDDLLECYFSLRPFRHLDYLKHSQDFKDSNPRLKRVHMVLASYERLLSFPDVM